MSNPHILQDHREMTSRWNGTYIGVKADDVIKPFYVHEFHRNKTLSGWFSSGNTDLLEITHKDLIFERPSFGMVNYDRISLVVQGVPRRQWKRGYRGQNMQLINPFRQETNKIGLYISDRLLNNYDFICELFNPQYPSVQQAIDDVRELRCVSRAFNHKFAIGLKEGFMHPRVFYKGINIGKLNPDNSVTLRKQSTHLFEELSQYLLCHKGV